MLVDQRINPNPAFTNSTSKKKTPTQKGSLEGREVTVNPVSISISKVKSAALSAFAKLGRFFSSIGHAIVSSVSGALEARKIRKFQSASEKDFVINATQITKLFGNGCPSSSRRMWLELVKKYSQYSSTREISTFTEFLSGKLRVAEKALRSFKSLSGQSKEKYAEAESFIKRAKAAIEAFSGDLPAINELKYDINEYSQPVAKGFYHFCRNLDQSMPHLERHRDVTRTLLNIYYSDSAGEIFQTECPFSELNKKSFKELQRNMTCGTRLPQTLGQMLDFLNGARLIHRANKLITKEKLRDRPRVVFTGYTAPESEASTHSPLRLSDIFSRSENPGGYGSRRGWDL